MKSSEIISEIEEILPTDYRGGSRDLYFRRIYKTRLISGSEPLPGGSGLMYKIVWFEDRPRIIIFEPEMLKKTGEAVGRLVLEVDLKFPLQPAYQVDTITTHENYRGKGIAKSLYGLALLPKPHGLGGILLAGSSQTPMGQKNWVSLANIAGVEISGYLELGDVTGGFIPEKEKLFQKIVNELYGKIGAQYLGKMKTKSITNHYFEFPVAVKKDKLESIVKNSIIQIYSGTANWKPNWKHYLENFDILDMINTGLMARYTG
jgi:hypothetical protein